MWGLISTEASYQFNFNTSFSTSRSDVLVHLAQWQYWWWFWFAFVWSLYYITFIRVFKYRSLKMRPKIMTSYRPHGKWGDFLAAIIPALWCLNILTNSNFILRLIEWQNESSLITIRIRARQWYWVYKYDLKSLTDVLSVPKNIGSNKWLVNFFGNMETSDDYLHILQLRRGSKWIKSYWSNLNQKLADSKNNISYLTFDKNTKNNSNINISMNLLKNKFISNWLNYKDKKNIFFLKKSNNLIFFFNFHNDNNANFNIYNTFFFNILYTLENNSSRFFNDFTENSRFIKKNQGQELPFRFLKNFIPLENNNLVDNFFFNFFFGKGQSNLNQKEFSDLFFLVLKQKKYTRREKIQNQFFLIEKNNKNIKISGRPILLNNSFFEEYISDPNISYRLLKKNKKRNELIPTTLAKRILRTKKTLILPAHTNITLITNSFDIVHSWFIPGLGVKLDCVPGRSTHHTFYVDNVGFYFGQCAEICGRYHHHMPIKICAFPFAHFLLWWNIFGVTKLLSFNVRNNNSINFSEYKYVW